MEFYGFKNCLAFLLNQGISILKFVTDRHSSITCYMRENYPDISHRFDLWHVAKSKLLLSSHVIV